MLEKKSKNLYIDAHFHYFDGVLKQSLNYQQMNFMGCSSALSKEQWEIQQNAESYIIKALGIHPCGIDKNHFKDDIDFIEKQLQKNLFPIGECGIDYYDGPDESEKDLQNYVFSSLIDLAVKYQVPLIIHSRKANQQLLEYSDRLKLLPGVLFHSFMGNSLEAQCFLNKKINACFSFNKQILNGNKRVLDCCTNLPLSSLLCETDGPYQFLKDEEKTYSTDIIKVYEKMFSLRKDVSEYEDFVDKINLNYFSLFKTVFN